MPSGMPGKMYVRFPWDGGLQLSAEKEAVEVPLEVCIERTRNN